MSTDKDIRDELNKLNSGLPGNDGKTSYEVPQGYFEGFAASVLGRINETGLSAAEEISSISPLLAGLHGAVTYSVPDNYFADNIESLATVTSGNEESLVLSFIDREMPYQVPLGYFAGFPETVLEKLNRSARVVPMKRRRWMHVAAAAMVAGVITLSGLAYFKSGTGSGDPVTVEIQKASTEELNAFIKTIDTNQPDGGSTAQTTADVKHLLKDVSDKELEAFLSQVPTDDEEEFDIN